MKVMKWNETDSRWIDTSLVLANAARWTVVKCRKTKQCKKEKILPQYCVLNATVTLLHILSNLLSCLLGGGSAPFQGRPLGLPVWRKTKKNDREWDFVGFSSFLLRVFIHSKQPPNPPTNHPIYQPTGRRPRRLVASASLAFMLMTRHCVRPRTASWLFSHHLRPFGVYNSNQAFSYSWWSNGPGKARLGCWRTSQGGLANLVELPLIPVDVRRQHCSHKMPHLPDQQL